MLSGDKGLASTREVFASLGLELDALMGCMDAWRSNEMRGNTQCSLLWPTEPSLYTGTLLPSMISLYRGIRATICDSAEATA